MSIYIYLFITIVIGGSISTFVGNCMFFFPLRTPPAPPGALRIAELPTEKSSIEDRNPGNARRIYHETKGNGTAFVAALGHRP